MDPEVPSQKDEPILFKRTYTIPGPYLGLQNIGATCYMNSVLQTLFMTPEFRRGLFDWKYADDDEADKDSIPFQLQRMFGRLQTKIFEYMDTRDLIKSFQWNVNQAFEQHDIQEFIRVLFDAIEQSLGPNEFNFVKDLYEGITLHYTKCLKCGYESSRQETFLDYSLMVKNKYEKYYNDSLQKAMQHSLKPELLNGSNQYFCEVCQCKQDAQRGSKFLKVPALFCLHVQRFLFDYMQMKRMKIDDYQSFPFVLNMNHYINGYDSIPNKLSEEVDASQFEDNIKRPVKPLAKQTTSAPTSLPFPPIPPIVKANSQTKKTAAKPGKGQASSQTKSFLEDIKKRKKEGNIKGDEMNVEIYESVDQQTQMAIEQSLSPELNTPNTPQGENQDHTAMEIEPQTTDQSTLPMPPPPPPPPPIAPPTIDISKDAATLENLRKKVQQYEQSEPDPKEVVNFEEDRQLYFAHVNHKTRQHNEECDRLIAEAQKDGEYVYQLYSILNHQGGAFGGHYYAFIKSFESGRWYCFNDGNVTGLDPSDIPKRAFGGSQNNSAYMLFYRRVDPGQQTYATWGGQFSDEDLPSKVHLKIVEERKNLQEYLDQGGTVEGLAHNVRQFTLKVYFKLEYKLVQCQSTDSFETFQNTAFKLFDIQDAENCRLRGYVAHADILTDTYTGKERLTLNQLKIQTYKTFSFEFRTDPTEPWSEYDQSTINLRYTVWQENIKLADEIVLEKHKLIAKRSWTLTQVSDAICEKTGIAGPLLISRRVSDYGLDLAKPLDLNKTIEELDIQENWVLYAEPMTETSKWATQFDIDTHTVTIRYNHPDGISPDMPKEGHLECTPNVEFPYIASIDNRLTLADLKAIICSQLGLDVLDVIIRRGGRAGLEIKDLKPVLELSHFVKGSSIYLERGCPLNQGEYRAIICLSDRSDNIMEDRNIYNFIEVGEYPVHGDKSLSTLKPGIFEWVSRKLGQEFNPSEYRLRERISERLTKVYRDNPLKVQGILEKRMIAIERLLPGQSEWLTPRDVLLLVRFWDQANWQLSDRFELIVQRNDSTLDLAKRLHAFFPHVLPENMEACRIVALYKFNRYDLFSEEWFSLNSEDLVLGSQPLFVMNDGQMIIIRDLTQEPRDLTEEEQKQFGIIQSQHAQKKQQTKSYPRINAPSFPAMQEKALTITVKKKTQQATEVPQEDTVQITPQEPTNDQVQHTPQDPAQLTPQDQPNKELSPESEETPKE